MNRATASELLYRCRRCRRFRRGAGRLVGGVQEEGGPWCVAFLCPACEAEAEAWGLIVPDAVIHPLCEARN